MATPAALVSLDDKILDGIVAKIKAARDAEVLIEPALAYDLDKNRTTPWQDLKRPLVDCELESDTPERLDYTAKYSIICLVPTLDDDATAIARLSVLKEQVRRALLSREDPDLGQAPGAIARITRPSWSRIDFDDEVLTDTILAGKWSLEVTYAYSPEPLSGPALSAISVTMERFAALYNLGGNP